MYQIIQTLDVRESRGHERALHCLHLLLQWYVCVAMSDLHVVESRSSVEPIMVVLAAAAVVVPALAMTVHSRFGLFSLFGFSIRLRTSDEYK